MTYFQDLFFNPFILAFLTTLAAFLFSLKIYPTIIHIVQVKNLMDEPSKNHSIHKNRTPTLGGVGLFIVFSLSIILLGVFIGLRHQDLSKMLGLVAATMILMFLGAKDDLLNLSPIKKFGGQLVSSFIVVFMTDIRITSFFGLLGIYELSYIASILFTIFVFLLVINSYNLIDGIDGLAGSIAIVSSLSFGVFFLLNDNRLMSLISFTLIGALIGFLRYNLSREKKIFMGDSGSMFVGYLLAYQGIGFLALNGIETSQYAIPNAPILLLAVLSFPLLDTLRVFSVRARKGLSPFNADRNHIHHRLLNMGLKHGQASLLISMCNILIITLSFLVLDFNINIQLVICVGLGSIIYLLPFLMPYKNEVSVIEEDIQMVTGETKITQKIPVVPVQYVAYKSTQKELYVKEEHIEEEINLKMKKIFSKRLLEFKKLRAGSSSKKHQNLKK